MSADKKIIINADEGEKRVAFVEDGALTGFLMEREDREKRVGFIYKGIVKNILSGIEAAFVDIGIGKNGFLHFSDIEESEEADSVDVLDEDASGENGEEAPVKKPRGRGRGRSRTRKQAASVKVGDEVLVQVVKDQIGDKGVRLTTNLSFPGRYIVFMPHSKLRGISKRITDRSERSNIRAMLKDIVMPKDTGLIVRTVSKGVTTKTISQEVKYLDRIWRGIKQQDQEAAPACLYENIPFLHQVVRDSLTDDVSEVMIDDSADYKQMLKFIGMSFPSYKKKIKLYRSKVPIFTHYNLGGEMEKALRRKIWIKGGAYLIFDRTEALVAIDVNSGRSSGGRNSPDETILRTNIEAAKEIARQLQIRNIGGIIIIDFIDMRRSEHRKKVLQVLQQALSEDRAKIKIYPVSRLGLIEMTRQRVNETLGKEIYERCPHCDGLGVVKSVRSVWLDILRSLKEVASTTKEKRLRIVFSGKMLNAEILDQMHVLKKLEKTYRIRVALEPSDDINVSEFEIYSLETGNKIK